LSFFCSVFCIGEDVERGRGDDFGSSFMLTAARSAVAAVWPTIAGANAAAWALSAIKSSERIFRNWMAFHSHE